LIKPEYLASLQKSSGFLFYRLAIT